MKDILFLSLPEPSELFWEPVSNKKDPGEVKKNTISSQEKRAKINEDKESKKTPVKNKWRAIVLIGVIAVLAMIAGRAFGRNIGSAIVLEDDYLASENTTLGMYDPTTNKDAHYGMQFIEAADGTGRWYVYSYDNGSEIAVAEPQKLSQQKILVQESAEKVKRMITIVIILIFFDSGVAWFIFRSMYLKQKRQSKEQIDKVDIP